MKYWVNWAGPPGKLVLDLDTAFADSFAKLTSDQAIGLKAAGGQAHWQNGVAERYGRSWKDTWEKVCEAQEVRDEDLLEAVAAVNDARNTLRNRSGFSPRQWVFGSNGRLVPDLEDGGSELSALYAATPGGAMARKHTLKNAARIAFYEGQTSEAISHALAHKTRVKPRDWKPGDLVYVYREDKRKGKKGVSQWLGPCTVVGAEGSNYWLARGGRCLLAAPQHLREAVHEEVSETLRIKAALFEAQKMLDNEFEEFEDVRDEPPPYEVEMEPELTELVVDREIEGSLPASSSKDMKGILKRKEVKQNEERLQKAARQNRALDDLPTQFKSQAEDTEHEVMYVKKFSQHDPKALEKEIPWNLIPENERGLFREAEEKQWKEHLEFGAVKPLSLEESMQVEARVGKERILPARFLYRDKNLAKRRADPSVQCRAKARLCVGGQKDPDLGNIHMVVDAPTANRQSLLLGLTVALSRGWLVTIGDIRSAFLNGVEAPRQLYFRQPTRGIPGLQSGQLIEILKGVFGLATSPKLWWLKLSGDLIHMKVKVEGVEYFMEQNEIDPCAFRLCHMEGERKLVEGMVFTHVDDLMVMASPKVMEALKSALSKIGFLWMNGRAESLSMSDASTRCSQRRSPSSRRAMSRRDWRKFLCHNMWIQKKL